ncbi:MAG: hypothetical protein AB2L14_07270 [Candidatus Xenobiia bacterium LiM19]
MKKIQTKAELIAIVNKLPEEKIPMVAEILEALTLYSEVVEKHQEEYEDEKLSESELLRLAEADQDITAGRGKTWEQVKVERGI